MKTVIYKVNGIYHCTNEENYNARVQNARQIKRLEDFESATEIIEYFNKYFGSTTEDFIVIDNQQGDNQSPCGK